jgi:hypothetical protein
MVWMFLIGCVGFGVAWLVQECRKITDEDLDKWLEQKSVQKFTKLVGEFIEINSSMNMYFEYYMELPQEKLEQYLKVRDELFAYMENNPYLPQDVVESVYSVNRANNNLFRAYNIDINVGA